MGDLIGLGKEILSSIQPEETTADSEDLGHNRETALNALKNLSISGGAPVFIVPKGQKAAFYDRIAMSVAGIEFALRHVQEEYPDAFKKHKIQIATPDQEPGWKLRLLRKPVILMKLTAEMSIGDLENQLITVLQKEPPVAPKDRNVNSKIAEKHQRSPKSIRHKMATLLLAAAGIAFPNSQAQAPAAPATATPKPVSQPADIPSFKEITENTTFQKAMDDAL